MGTSGAIWDDCSALDRLRSCPPRVMLASLANSRARVAAGRRELPYYENDCFGGTFASPTNGENKLGAPHLEAW